MCFVDYEKAFLVINILKHDELLAMPTSIKGEGKDLRLIKRLCWKQSVTIMVEKEEPYEIEEGVRQSHSMWLDFFNLYREIITREVQITEGSKLEAKTYMTSDTPTILFSWQKQNRGYSS